MVWLVRIEVVDHNAHKQLQPQVHSKEDIDVEIQIKVLHGERERERKRDS